NRFGGISVSVARVVAVGERIAVFGFAEFVVAVPRFANVAELIVLRPRVMNEPVVRDPKFLLHF
ncbi:MAG: hypothetical protein ACRD32_09090, partial [Nitrososphaerales archaeon]